MARDLFTLVFVSRLSRDAVLAYLFVGTGLLPHDRPPSCLTPQLSLLPGARYFDPLMMQHAQPRYNKQECLTAIESECKRLGEPLRGDNYMDPDEIVAHVAQHLASDPGGLPPAPKIGPEQHQHEEHEGRCRSMTTGP